MSQANQGFWLSRLASADLSTHRYKAMKLAASNGVNIVTNGAADVVIGFLQNKPTSGKAASIAVGGGSGTCKAMAAAAIAEGALVKVDNNGKIVTGGGGGDRNWGIALEAAGADGDVIEILPIALLVS